MKNIKITDVDNDRVTMMLCGGMKLFRRCVVTKCYPNTQIFARFPTKSNITLDDAEQAHSICKNVPEEIKNDCYLTFGVDRRKTEKYLETVKELESAYHRQTIFDIIRKVYENIKYYVIQIITLIKMCLI